MAGIALIIILAGVAGWTLHYYKSRLDRLEEAQREQRLPYRVNDELENSTAIVARLLRELELDDLRRKQMYDELERLIEKTRWMRGNGQKGRE